MCPDKQCADCFLVRETHENVKGLIGKPAAAHSDLSVACCAAVVSGKEHHRAGLGDAETREQQRQHLDDTNIDHC